MPFRAYLLRRKISARTGLGAYACWRTLARFPKLRTSTSFLYYWWQNAVSA